MITTKEFMDSMLNDPITTEESKELTTLLADPEFNELMEDVVKAMLIGTISMSIKDKVYTIYTSGLTRGYKIGAKKSAIAELEKMVK